MPQLERSHEVFVSSTYKDLKEERQVVLQTLLAANCIPSGMELFPNGDPDVWELIKRQIDRCDIYVLILGSRYGQRRKGATLSFTHEEFRYAADPKKKKTILIYPLLNPEVQKPAMWNDQSAEDQAALKGFFDEVAPRATRPWSKIHDLEVKLSGDIGHWLNRVPASWARVSEDVLSAFGEEIDALKERFASPEIKELTTLLKSTLRRFQFDRVKGRIDRLGEVLPFLSKREWGLLIDFARAQVKVRTNLKTAPDDPMARSIIDLVKHYEAQMREIENDVIEVHGDQLINAVSGYFIGAVKSNFRAVSNDDFAFWANDESDQYYNNTLKLRKNERNVERTFVVPRTKFLDEDVKKVLRRQISDKVKVRIISSEKLGQVVSSPLDRDFGLHDDFAVSFFRNYHGRSYKVNTRPDKVEEFSQRFTLISENAEVVPGKTDDDDRLFTEVAHLDAWIDRVKS